MRRVAKEYMQILFARDRVTRFTLGSEVVEVREGEGVGYSKEMVGWEKLPAETRPAGFHPDWADERTEWRGWHCYAYDPAGQAKRLEVDLGDWFGGTPMKGITEVLNRYAAEGWVVVSISEDKGLYQGTDVRDESFPSRVRYLLERARPEREPH